MQANQFEVYDMLQ